MKRIFLSAPMHNCLISEARSRFLQAKTSISRRANEVSLQFEIFTPDVFLDYTYPQPPEALALLRLKELLESDGIGMLAGWKSDISKMEMLVANYAHIPIVYIEPPINELDIISLEGSNPELYRYWQHIVARWASEKIDEEVAVTRSLAEISNRFLDPHGFEYINQ